MATSQASPNSLLQLGLAYDKLFSEAWELFKKDTKEDYERCSEICVELLSHADLSDMHSAGCHYMLGMGQEIYLFHAQKAVEIYKNLYTVRPGSSWRGDREPTELMLRNQAELLAQAERSLALAQKEHDEIENKYWADRRAWAEEHGREPTDAELVQADLDSQREGPDGIDEFNARWDEAQNQDTVETGAMPADPEEAAKAAADDEYNADIKIIKRVPTPPGSA